ncbi:MAG TPA: hypothetical protein VMA53_00310 [Stellaceae bacterium]|nr:hypothetical protein [Stellaceae bacterium]
MTSATAVSASADARAEGAVASLGRFTPPFEIDRFGASFGLGPARPSGVLKFRFCFNEVPFTAETERRNDQPVLSLTGELGVLPFTIENARRRRRLRKVLAVAQSASGLSWEITRAHEIRATGEIDLGLPLTPMAVIAGAATLLLRSRPYLDLIVAVGGES